MPLLQRLEEQFRGSSDYHNHQRESRRESESYSEESNRLAIIPHPLFGHIDEWHSASADTSIIPVVPMALIVYFILASDIVAVASNASSQATAGYIEEDRRTSRGRGLGFYNP